MRVLIIEDEIGISNFLRLSLESDYSVVEQVQDGESGLELLKKNTYDLVLLDNQLPGITGLEVARVARNCGVTCPIMGVSVLGQTGDKVAFLNAGGDDYITKPFAIEELRARIYALMRRPKQIELDVLEAGDISLHVQTHKVFRGKKEIKLTRKEYMLLEYLLRNRGVVLSRAMILEHVWDVNTDPFTYTIEAHITSLRKKLGDKDRTIIETITGSGYRLNV